MIRRVIVAVLRLALRVFFRHIEVRGLARVPRRGAAVFVLNHPNALVDPAFVLCHAPRRVSFLAKAPIFELPLLGRLARALDAIPVYRRQEEGADTAHNRETFERARELLRRGGTIAVCPEGVSHSDTKLKPLKTGTARIALGVLGRDPALDLRIVPAGLYYTAKTAFRSSALLHFGEPLKVEPAPLDETGEPPREAVQHLSARIAAALREVTLNAEHEQALDVIVRAERIFSADERAAPSLARQLELRRRFLSAYAYHFTHSPARLAALETRLSRYEAELRQAGLDPEDLYASRATRAGVARHLFTRVLPVVCFAPLALAGLVVHYPAYRLAGFFATTFARESDDVVSTIKIIAALLLFPLTWAALAVLLFQLVGWPGAAAALAVAPLAGYVAVRFCEELDQFAGGARALLYFTTRRRFFRQLLVERRRLREEMVRLGEEAARADGAPVVSIGATGNTI